MSGIEKIQFFNVGTFGDLPSPAPDGSLGITRDTDTLYTYDATTGTWKPLATPGGGGPTGPVGATGPAGPTGTGATGPTGSIYPTGGSPDRIFYENQQTVTVNYTVTTNYNAMSAGPVAINSGITVTVPSGSYWTIV